LVKPVPKPSYRLVREIQAGHAGSLLTASFNVAVIAPDDSGGGVNWASTGEFAHVPPAVQATLRTNFGYYKVTGVDLRADYIGGPNVIYRRQTMSQDVYQRNFDVVADSVQNVDTIRKTRPRPGDLSDIAPAGGTPSDAAAIRQSVAVGFYPVADAASGAIGGLRPADAGYAAAALAAARASGLMFAEGDRLPAQGAIRTRTVPNLDPAKSYGIAFTISGKDVTSVTSYERPGASAGSQARFRAFALPGGRMAVGIEASPTVASRDFADLVVKGARQSAGAIAGLTSANTPAIRSPGAGTSPGGFRSRTPSHQPPRWDQWCQHRSVRR